MTIHFTVLNPCLFRSIPGVCHALNWHTHSSWLHMSRPSQMLFHHLILEWSYSYKCANSCPIFLMYFHFSVSTFSLQLHPYFNMFIYYSTFWPINHTWPYSRLKRFSTNFIGILESHSTRRTLLHFNHVFNSMNTVSVPQSWWMIDPR